MLEKTRALCNSFPSMGVPGFDLVVYHNGQQVLRHMGGCSDVENRLPVNGRELYNIYSCSKPITCAAAMQLWEKGAFRLEDELRTYMPEFADMTVRTPDGIRKAENPIRIRHLFEMTAGFGYNLESPQMLLCREETEGRCPTRETMRYLAREPLNFEPGTKWAYSLCHDVLAALVEVLSGERFEDYVAAHIFRPLGMTRSTFLLPDERLGEIAAQYRFNRETGERTCIGPRIWFYKPGSEYASGGAGCISTVDDYIKFLEAMRTGTILSKDTVALMATDRLTEDVRPSYGAGNPFGYGLGMRTPKQGGIDRDFGWDGAAGSYLAIDTDHDLSIFYAQHMLTSPNQGIRPRVYDHVMAELIGDARFSARIQEMEKAGTFRYVY